MALPRNHPQTVWEGTYVPNRMIRESMLVSDKIASLSDFEFRVWIGLILSVDDMGRGDARAAIIRGRVFPLRERVTLRDVDGALHGLAAKGCISLYEVDGKSYFWFPTWGKHQRIRDVKPKYPDPMLVQGPPVRGGSSSEAPPAQGRETPCRALPQSAAERGGARPEDKTKPNQDEVEPEPEDEAEPRARACSPAAVAVAAKVGELSPKSRAELDGFVRDMGEACVLRALDIAQDAGKMTWRYVRGILRQKQAQGVACLEDWDKVENSFRAARGRGKGAIAGTPGDVQPTPERVRQNAGWLEEFLREQEPGPA